MRPTKWVDPSMSEKSRVTVPVGSPCIDSVKAQMCPAANSKSSACQSGQSGCDHTLSWGTATRIVTSPGALQQLGEHVCCSGGATALNWQVGHVATDLRDDRGRQRIGVGLLLVVHASPGAVAIESVPDVEVLLEVVPQRHVDERAPVGGELHGRGEPTLDDRNIRRREVLVETWHVAAHGGASPARQDTRVDPRTRYDQEVQVRELASREGYGVEDPLEQRQAHAGSANCHHAQSLVVAVAESG